MQSLEKPNILLQDTKTELHNIKENLQSIETKENQVKTKQIIESNISSIISLIKKIENYLEDAKDPFANFIFVDRGW